MNLAKWLIIGGIGLIAIGILIWAGFPLGKLPGDIHIKSERSEVYIPLTTFILISILLTLIVNFIAYLMRK